MRRSFRKSSSSPRIPSEYFQDSYNVECWPLLPGYGLMGVVGGNHLVTANATPYGPEKISSEGAYFNGVSNCLKSTRTVDLSGTNKVSVYVGTRFNLWNLTVNQMVFELSDIVASYIDAFNLVQVGNGAYDLRTQIKGNVGYNDAEFYPSTFNLTDKNSHAFCAVFDKSAISNEVNLFKDGITLTPNTRISNNNNTNNFSNKTFYIGMRAGTLLPFQGYQKNILIRSTVDSSETIADFNAWQNDTRRANFVSLFMDRKRRKSWIDIQLKKL